MTLAANIAGRQLGETVAELINAELKTLIGTHGTEALALIEELPSRADEFGESVGEKLRDIAETIENTGEVTEGQRTAIENMAGGIRRWIR